MRVSQRFESLVPHAARLVEARLPDLIAADPGREADFALRVGPLYANFARHRLDREAWAALLELAGQYELPGALQKLAGGAHVNGSEDRPALHTALRGDHVGTEASRQAHLEAGRVRARMAELVEQIEASPVTDVINVGIGGSDLGPRMVVDALAQPGRTRVHFLANVDAHSAQRLLRQLDPATTAAVVVSKSFGTQETLINAAIIRDWLGEGGGARMYAVSANTDRAARFGIAGERVLPMWDWVGGRFSLWSAVGFGIAIALGNDGFERLLAGASDMDAHVLSAPPESNLAIWHALVSIWNRNALGQDSQAVMPYDKRLALLPSYLQQLVMESLGKSVRSDGEPVGVPTAPVIWGGAGSNSQHSFFQALHQGTDRVPVDFIGVIRPAHQHPHSHQVLLANLLAQAESLANGQEDADPQKSYAGSRASTMFLLDALTPEALGALLAMYEHSVYLQATLWGINAFDQWGVELGKRIADQLLPAVEQPQTPADDAITRALLAQVHARR